MSNIYDFNFLLRFPSSYLPDLNPSKALNRPKGWVSDWDVTGFDTKFIVSPTWAFDRWSGLILKVHLLNKLTVIIVFADLPQIVFGGGRGIVTLPFELQSSHAVRSFCFSILAKSASIAVTTSVIPSGPGYVLQLDHFNEKTRSKEFRVFSCPFVKQHENNCEKIYEQNVIIQTCCSMRTPI
jgi:hypothetical protein